MLVFHYYVILQFKHLSSYDVFSLNKIDTIFRVICDYLLILKSCYNLSLLCLLIKKIARSIYKRRMLILC